MFTMQCVTSCQSSGYAAFFKVPELHLQRSVGKALFVGILSEILAVLLLELLLERSSRACRLSYKGKVGEEPLVHILL